MDQLGTIAASCCSRQERQQLLAFAAQIVRCGLTRPHKVTDRLVNRVRHPHRCQLACPMQACQRDRIPPVGLDVLARPFRDQRRGDHHAVMAQIPNVAI